jgi:isoquinoline 1-oxidoreductase beta subunit
MAAILNISRRDFIKTSGAASALVIGANFVPGGLVSEAQAQAVAQPNLFVSIAGDGVVTITCSRAEMGQGARTGIPMILADELEADWDRCTLWQAPGDETKYDPAGKDGQNTDGSRSTRHHLDVMRQLGAAARKTLEMCTRNTTVSTIPVQASHLITVNWWTSRRRSSCRLANFR